MLDVSATPRISPSPPPGGTNPASSASWTIPNLLRRVLPGMVARGHGIDALSLYLGLARTALLDLIVELDLPTPHDRPLRKPGGRNPWTFADTTLFIVLWMAGWHAESLGERFGRSPGGARYKARHLGLPRRDRKLVFRPPRPGEDLPGGILQGLRPDPGSAVRITPAQADDADAEEPAPWEQHHAATYGSTSSYPAVYPAVITARGTPDPSAAIILPFPAFQDADLFAPTPVGTPPVRKPKRKEVPWTRERDQELGQRWWARQHYKAIARDMGVSPSSVQSRRFRLELPTLRNSDLFLFQREELVDHFDPSVVAEHIAAAGYFERKCNKFLSEGKIFWFWTKRRNGAISSREFERLKDKATERFKALPPPVRPHAPVMHAW